MLCLFTSIDHFVGWIVNEILLHFFVYFDNVAGEIMFQFCFLQQKTFEIFKILVLKENCNEKNFFRVSF